MSPVAGISQTPYRDSPTTEGEEGPAAVATRGPDGPARAGVHSLQPGRFCQIQPQGRGSGQRPLLREPPGTAKCYTHLDQRSQRSRAQGRWTASRDSAGGAGRGAGRGRGGARTTGGGTGRNPHFRGLGEDRAEERKTEPRDNAPPFSRFLR